MQIVYVNNGPFNDDRFAVFLDDHLFFQQSAAFDGIANAIAVIIFRNFLADAELLALFMVKSNDTAVIQCQTFVRRKMSRCPTEGGGSVAVVLKQGVDPGLDIFLAAQRAGGFEQY